MVNNLVTMNLLEFLFEFIGGIWKCFAQFIGLILLLLVLCGCFDVCLCFESGIIEDNIYINQDFNDY